MGPLISEEEISRERDQLRLILSNLREGLIALDSEENIIEMNDGAFRLLGPAALRPARGLLGASLIEVIRNASLQRFVRKTLESGQAGVEETISIDLGHDERYLQIYASPLANANLAAAGMAGVGRPGLLLVLYDVTRVHHLENVRRDFVANVSHELKTPITSIKGFVETLLDGAVDNPEDARRFLGIISRQADRLNSIFEDLLSLSRIEQERERGGIRLEERSVADIVEEAVQSCQFFAEERKIRLVREVPEGMRAVMHPTLLEQALVNLIDNAIKFSDPGAVVRVLAIAREEEIELRVEDNGKGIERSHLPRIFERFYRVNKARSRREGGTGLGLAIVKHIAQAHRGRATVESEPGQGSVFKIHLPRLALQGDGTESPGVGADSNGVYR